MQGAIYDVIVDLRKNHQHLNNGKDIFLSADNHRQLLVPKGFAHGFCTLVPHTIVMYKVDEYYSAEHDSGLLWEDKDLAIPWPVTDPILSDKDQILPLLEEYEDSF